MLARFKAVAWIVCLLLSASAFAQQAPKDWAFEVATIKPVEPGAPILMVGGMPTADGIDAQNVTVPMLMRMAYGYMKFPLDEQVTGTPDWAKTQKFNIKAKMSEADAQAFQKLSRDERNDRIDAMLQALLAERFKLTVHRSKKELPDYELVIAKGGFKLKPSDANDPALLKGKDGNPLPAGMVMFQRDGSCTFQQNTMDQLANFLTAQGHELGRNVLNKTGLSGQYTFSLHWSPNRPAGGDAADAPSIFTALEEDLGLRLQPSKGDVEILVIDHVERPTEN